MKRYFKWILFAVVIIFIIFDSHKTATLIYFGIYPSVDFERSTIQTVSEKEPVPVLSSQKEIKYYRDQAEIAKMFDKVLDNEEKKEEIKQVIKELDERTSKQLKKYSDFLDPIRNRLMYYRVTSMYYMLQDEQARGIEIYEEGLNFVRRIENEMPRFDNKTQKKLKDAINSYKNLMVGERNE